MFTHARVLLSIAALVAPVFSQTSTLCNPLDGPCDADPALGTTFNQTFTSSSELASDYWTVTGVPSPSFPDDNSGSAFIISSEGEAPTVVTPYYIFWGHVEVIMRAASGQGIISSIVLLSDDLDEIDWEIMGGNTTHVENNYYGKGNTSELNALYYPCDNPQGGFHNYTVNWSSESIQWILDGNVVRTVTPEQAVDSAGKTMYPQTPMQLKIGNWAGGDSKNAPGTIAWAGGLTDFGAGPYTMTVASVKVIDGSTNATQYSYGDHSGTWQSIKVEEGQSKASKSINAAPSLTIAQRWANLSSGAQIAVICVAAGVGGALFLAFIFCCCRQRRAGKRARAAADTAWNKEQIDLLEYKRMWPGQHDMYSKLPTATMSERY